MNVTVTQIKKIFGDLVLDIIADVFLTLNTKSEKRPSEFVMQVLNYETNYFLVVLRT